MDRQTLRDWVTRYNETGIAGLSDQPHGGGTSPKLTDAEKAVEAGQDFGEPAEHAVERGVFHHQHDDVLDRRGRWHGRSAGVVPPGRNAAEAGAVQGCHRGVIRRGRALSELYSIGSLSMRMFLMAAARVLAAGCVSGGAVGAVAGHEAGHGVLGAAAGCAIGHHEADKQKGAAQQQAQKDQQKQPQTAQDK